jgi:hypothetical protein
MSQSDLIKHKRIGTILKMNKLDTIFTNQDYIDFKQYEIANTIENTTTLTTQLVPSGYNLIFGIEKKVSECTSFIICKDTEERANKIAPLEDWNLSHRVVRKYVKQPTTAKSACDCLPNSVNNNICGCKTSH